MYTIHILTKKNIMVKFVKTTRVQCGYPAASISNHPHYVALHGSIRYNLMPPDDDYDGDGERQRGREIFGYVHRHYLFLHTDLLIPIAHIGAESFS